MRIERIRPIGHIYNPSGIVPVREVSYEDYRRTFVESNADYITINPAVAHGKFNVCVMKWHPSEDSYIVFRISEALPEAAAQALARSWSAATRLEIR